MDSLLVFPRSAVQTNTETCLTSEIETGSGEPRPSGRPTFYLKPYFINFTAFFEILRIQSKTTLNKN